MRSTLATSAAFASSCAGDSAPVTPRSDARTMITGMPLSMQVTSIPSKVSVTAPVGSSEPLLEPATSRNSSAMGAAVPGTPSMRASPSYSTAPCGVRTCATARDPVFTMWMRTGVVGPADGHEPVLDGPGPDARENVAAILAVTDTGLVHDHLQE